MKVLHESKRYEFSASPFEAFRCGISHGKNKHDSSFVPCYANLTPNGELMDGDFTVQKSQKGAWFINKGRDISDRLLLFCSIAGGFRGGCGEKETANATLVSSTAAGNNCESNYAAIYIIEKGGTVALSRYGRGVNEVRLYIWDGVALQTKEFTGEEYKVYCDIRDGILAPTAAIEIDLFESRVNALRRIPFTCENLDRTIFDKYYFNHKQCRPIVATAVSVADNLDGEIETMLTHAKGNAYTVWGFRNYTLSVEVPFSTPFIFTCSRFVCFGNAFYKEGEADAQAIEEGRVFSPTAVAKQWSRQANTDGVIETPETDGVEYTHFFTFPATTEKGKIEFTYLRPNGHGHNYITRCQCFWRKNGEVIEIPHQTTWSIPTFVLTQKSDSSDDCAVLLPEGVECITSEVIKKEAEAQRQAELLEATPQDWDTVNFQNRAGTRRQGACRLLIMGEGEIYVFGGDKDGILPAKGLFSVLESARGSFTLLINPICATAVCYDDDLRGWGFEWNEERGCYEMEDVANFPATTISEMGLQRMDDTDPARCNQKRIFMPKDYGGFTLLNGEYGTISGGTLHVGGWRSMDGGFYDCTYYSGVHGDLPAPRFTVAHGLRFTVAEIKKIIADGLPECVIYS